MPRIEQFSANIGMLFAELPLLERFQAARAAGFSAVEINTQEMFKIPAWELKSALQAAQLKMALFNMPVGDREGDAGLAAQPGREKDFGRSLRVTAEYCIALDCPAVHCLAGDVHNDALNEAQMLVYLNNLQHAVEVLAPLGVVVCIEPLNPRLRPNYFLENNEMAAGVLAELGSKSVKLLFDFFHTQIISGDLTMAMCEFLPTAGHVQLAGVPDRHEPDDTQEVNYAFILAELDRLGYDGYVGLEYRPRLGRNRGATERGLGWLKPYGLVQRTPADGAAPSTSASSEAWVGSSKSNGNISSPGPAFTLGI